MLFVRLFITILFSVHISICAHSDHIEQWLQKYLNSESPEKLSKEQADMFAEWSVQMGYEIDAEYQLLEIQYMQAIPGRDLSALYERLDLFLSMIVAKIFHITDVLPRRAATVFARLSRAHSQCQTIENSMRVIDTMRQAILELHNLIWQAKKDAIHNAYCFGSVMCLCRVAYTTEYALLNRVYKAAKTYSYQESRKKIAADSVRIGENDKVHVLPIYISN